MPSLQERDAATRHALHASRARGEDTRYTVLPASKVRLKLMRSVGEKCPQAELSVDFGPSENAIWACGCASVNKKDYAKILATSDRTRFKNLD